MRRVGRGALSILDMYIHTDVHALGLVGVFGGWRSDARRTGGERKEEEKKELKIHLGPGRNWNG